MLGMETIRKIRLTLSTGMGIRETASKEVISIVWTAFSGSLVFGRRGQNLGFTEKNAK
jgi:hypothetical protein